jgi:hypothetical protein
MRMSFWFLLLSLSMLLATSKPAALTSLLICSPLTPPSTVLPNCLLPLLATFLRVPTTPPLMPRAFAAPSAPPFLMSKIWLLQVFATIWASRSPWPSLTTPPNALLALPILLSAPTSAPMRSMIASPFPAIHSNLACPPPSDCDRLQSSFCPYRS